MMRKDPKGSEEIVQPSVAHIQLALAQAEFTRDSMNNGAFFRLTADFDIKGISYFIEMEKVAHPRMCFYGYRQDYGAKLHQFKHRGCSQRIELSKDLDLSALRDRLAPSEEEGQKAIETYGRCFPQGSGEFGQCIVTG